MSTIARTFTAANQAGGVLLLNVGASATYDLSGTFVATILLQRSLNGMTWETVRSLTAAASGTISASDVQARFRFYCSAYTSGSPVTSLAETAAASGSATSSSTARERLQNWFAGNLSSKVIGVYGDSTMDTLLVRGFYERLQDAVQVADGALYGVTIGEYGSNGAPATAFLADTGLYPISHAIAHPADLYIFSFGINDVRSGASSAALLTASIVSITETIKAAVPNAEFIWLMPAPLTLNDYGSGYVTPNSSAQIYTTQMRDAYLAIKDLWSYVTMLDTQDAIFGRTCLTSPPWMDDQLHPNAHGQRAKADLIISTIGRGAAFSTRLSEAANATSYLAPFSSYRRACEDTRYWDLVAEGAWVAGGTGGGGYTDFAWPAGSGHTISDDDVVSYDDAATPFVLTSGLSTPSIGANTRLLGVVPPDFPPAGTRATVKVYRHKYGRDANVSAYLLDLVNYPYRVRCGIGFANDAGVWILRTRVNERAVANSLGWYKIRAGDTICIQGFSPIVMTGATFDVNSGQLQISLGSTLAAHGLKPCYIFGNHVSEGVAERQAMANAATSIFPYADQVYTSAAFTAARTAILPKAAMYGAGRKITFFDEAGTVTGANTWTIQRAGSDTISGATTKVLSAAYAMTVLVCDGVSKWTVVA